MNSFNLDEKKYRCCCNNFHVARGAYIIGIVGIVLCALTLLQGIVLLKYGFMVGGILGILRYASIIYAQKKQNPSLYLPFLILNSINIVLIGFYILVLAVMCMVPSAWEDFIDPEIKNMEESKKEQVIVVFRIATGVVIVLLAMLEFLEVWFQSVVYRAYKYMKMTHSSLSAQMHS